MKKRPTHAQVRRELQRILSRHVRERDGAVVSPAGLAIRVARLLMQMEGARK